MSTPAGDRERTLRDLVSQFWKIPLSAVDDQLVFDSKHLKNMSSTRFITFLGVVEQRLGVRFPDAGRVTSYVALRAHVLGEPPPPTRLAEVTHLESRAIARRPASGAAFGLGHDIEELSALPETNDWSGHPFYANNFTTAEINWCASQAEPKRHFAARFCAKEAARKAHPILMECPLRAIELANDPSGRPSLRILDETTLRSLGGHQLLVSISHSDSLASAVVIVIGG